MYTKDEYIQVGPRKVSKKKNYSPKLTEYTVYTLLLYYDNKCYFAVLSSEGIIKYIYIYIKDITDQRKYFQVCLFGFGFQERLGEMSQFRVNIFSRNEIK